MHDFFCLASQIGSSRVKSAVFDADGHMLSSCYERISFEYAGIRAEADPELWSAALLKTMRDAVIKSGSKDIGAICVCSLGPAEIFLDSSLKPLRKSIIWLDSRAVREAAFLSRASGVHAPPSFTAPVSMWLRDNEPEIFKKTAYVMQPLDYAALILTGIPSFSMLAETFTPFSKKQWDAASLSEELIPSKIRTGERIGGLSAGAATLIGIPSGIPVYAGTGGADVAETILGTGCLEPHIAGDKTGTSEGIEIISNERIPDSRFFVAPHPFLNGSWHAGAAMSSGGGTLDWFRRAFYGDSFRFESMISDASLSAPGCGGLVFLPYIAGERCPVADPDARGVFFGVSRMHERHDMLRAVMEGVAYQIREVLDIFASHGVRPSVIRASGLPSSIGVWNRIKADITGLPVQPALCLEPDLLGIVSIAAKGAGLFASFKEASGHMSKFGPAVEPSDEHRAEYDRNYRVYRELYPSLKSLFAGR
ncbi:MAG: hypothetical protein MJ234_00210 [bacterium]|nr:hypothetical protein [bacterium]